MTETLNTDTASFFLDRRPHNGLTYEAYVGDWKEKLSQSLKGLDKVARRYHFYAKYNDERAEKVAQAFTISHELTERIEALEEPQLWMILTEDWCVDSAYALPIIYAAASRNSLINIRILPRDANLDIMDRYLTNEARSIPKLVMFSEKGAELGTWGPRPIALQTMREDLKQASEPGNVISQKSVEWYESGGWREVETELIDLLDQVKKQTDS